MRSQPAEAYQIGSDAAWLLGRWHPSMGAPYNPSGRFARWAAASRANAAWLLDHGLALCEEHQLRFGSAHYVEPRLVTLAQVLLLVTPDGERTTLAMDEATTAYARDLQSAGSPCVGDLMLTLAVHRNQAWRLDPWCCELEDWPGERRPFATAGSQP